MHKHTQTTIDRALAGNVTITDKMVDGSTTLREVAIDYVQTYRGTNSFIQDLAVRLVDYGTLSVKQMRAALNQMIRDARAEAARKATPEYQAALAADRAPATSGRFKIDGVKRGDVVHTCERCGAPTAHGCFIALTYYSRDGQSVDICRYMLCDGCEAHAAKVGAIDAVEFIESGKRAASALTTIWKDATIYTEDHGAAAYPDRYEVGVRRFASEYTYRFAMDTIARDMFVAELVAAGAKLPAAASDVTAIVDGQFYIDLRSTSQREADDAGSPPAVEDQPAADNTRVPSSRYTIVINPDTDEYRTLRLVDAPEHFNAAPGTQIAQYLSGADNETSYTSFAFVVGRTLRVWRRFSGDSKIVDALRILLAGDPVAHMIKYGMVFDRCAICGRALSTPESRRAGIGPICAGRVEAEGYSVAIPAEDRQAARSRAISDMAELFND